jgi:hypothetical protein
LSSNAASASSAHGDWLTRNPSFGTPTIATSGSTSAIAFPTPYATADAVAYIRSVASEDPPASFVIVVADEPAGGIGLRQSVRVLEKAGNVREGLLQSSAVKAGGGTPWAF